MVTYTLNYFHQCCAHKQWDNNQMEIVVLLDLPATDGGKVCLNCLDLWKKNKIGVNKDTFS